MFRWLYWKLDNFLTYGRVEPFLSFMDHALEWMVSMGIWFFMIIGLAYTLQLLGISTPGKEVHFTVAHYLAMAVGDIFLLLVLIRVILFIKNHPERFGKCSW